MAEKLHVAEATAQTLSTEDNSVVYKAEDLKRLQQLSLKEEFQQSEENKNETNEVEGEDESSTNTSSNSSGDEFDFDT